MSKSLHESMGSKKHPDGSIDLTDKALHDSIVAAYNQKLASGEFKLLGGSEVKVPVPGRKVYSRTFIIDEGAE